MTDFMRAAVLAEAPSAEMRRLQHPALAVARRGSLWHVHLLGRSWLVPQAGERWSRWQSQQLVKSNSLDELPLLRQTTRSDCLHTAK